VDGLGQKHFVCNVCGEMLGVGGYWFDYECDCGKIEEVEIEND
jgi:hypothetical protein